MHNNKEKSQRLVFFSIVLLLAPFFLLGMGGYALRYFNFVSNDTIEGLNAFTFRIIIPCMLIRTVAQVSFPNDFPFDLLIAYYLPLGLLYLCCYTLFILFFKRNHPTSIIASLNAVFGNSVALGIPLAIIVFGAGNSLAYIILVTMHTPLVVLPSMVFLELYHTQFNVRSILIKLSRTLIDNPNIPAIVLGFFLNIFSISLPSFLDTSFAFLQDAALPCALIAIGGSMVRYGVIGHFSQALTATIFKMILLPVSVIIGLLFFTGLSPIEKQSLVLLASLPTGVTPFLLAGFYQNHGIRISTSCLFMAACLSAFTVTFFLYIANLLYT